MSDAIITDILTIAEIMVGFVLTAIGSWISARRAAQVRVRDLFAQVVKAVGALEVEKASFRERRDSWRPNFLAVGSAVMHLLAACAEGNWVRGAVAGVGDLKAWDSAEGERFIDRFQAAAGRGWASPGADLADVGRLQVASTEVGDAIGALMKARKACDVEAAAEQLHKPIAGLRGAVRAFGARKWWRPGKRELGPRPLSGKQVRLVCFVVDGCGVVGRCGSPNGHGRPPAMTGTVSGCTGNPDGVAERTPKACARHYPDGVCE